MRLIQKMKMQKEGIKEVQHRRAFRAFDSREKRLRSACPNCKSVTVQKRRSSPIYKCYRCGWEGNVVIKIEF